MSTDPDIRPGGATWLRAAAGGLALCLALAATPALAGPRDRWEHAPPRERGPHAPASRDGYATVPPEGRRGGYDRADRSAEPPPAYRGGDPRDRPYADRRDDPRYDRASPYGPRPESSRTDSPRMDSPRTDSLGADWRPRPDEARRGVREGRLAPLGQVIDQIRRRSPGRQLDAGMETDVVTGRSVYRVRWAGADGRRSDYIVDAESGRILGVDGR